MKISIVSPTKAFLSDYTEDELQAVISSLTYTNTTVQHSINRHYKNFFWKNKNPLSWENHLNTLKKQLKVILLFQEYEKFYIRPGSIPYLDNVRLEIENLIKYPAPKKMAWKNPPKFTLYPYQEESWKKLLEIKHGNVSLTTGCHSAGTKILMYDGRTKNVENIILGDLLMGPDSKPRKVLELHSGIDRMYKITPIKGESFVVNEGHILTLQRTNTGNTYLRKNGTRKSQENGPNPILNISVRDYLNLPKHVKHLYKLYRSTHIDFPFKKQLEIPPYILGLWLGDGHSNTAALTTMDEEIKNEWCEYLKQLGLDISILHKKNNKASCYAGIIKGGYKGRKKTQNCFNVLLKKMNLFKNKHIPIEYLTASREDRMQLLAGLIDTDGHYFKGYFEIIQKNRILADNILFLCRSLGFGVTSRNKKSKDQNGTEDVYVRIHIMGANVDKVPTRLLRKKALARKQIKEVLRTGFLVDDVGVGAYFGFSVDENKLYLMEDFTVTHNSGKSFILLKLTRELGLKTCIVVPSKSIFEELLTSFEHFLGKGKVGALGAGKRSLGKQITIAIADSLVNLEVGTEEYSFFHEMEVFLADESHTLPSETLESVCHGVLSEAPYRFFFSATQVRNDGSLPLLQSIIGKTVCSLTTEEAIKGGYICPHEFRIISVESSNPSFESTDALEQKREHFLKNKNIANFSAKLANSMANAGKGTLILVTELAQISILAPLLTVPYAIAHSEKKKDRLEELGIEKVDNAESVEKFNKGEVKVLIGTDCIATGTNIYPCHNVINWVGGSSPIKTKQGAVGRAVRFGRSNPWAEKCLPKDKAIIYDFNVLDNYTMNKHLEARIESYLESGKDLIKYVRLKI